MLDSRFQLVDTIFTPQARGMAAIRDGFGKGVIEAGEKDDRVVVVCADLADSTRAQGFKDRFPERYIEVGVAEQNLAALASGLAAYGKIPFIASYATFSPGRNNEQIRTTVALNDMPVKICGMHAGVSVGPDGATHQALEDIALMRVVPNMTVIAPCDAEEARKATIAVVGTNKPAYLRFHREKTPLFTTLKTPFTIGTANVLWNSEQPIATIVACGPQVFEALLAAQMLEQEKIETVVINNHTIKPIDHETIITHAKRSKAVVTVEEHQIAGGLGSAVAELLAQEFPVPIEFVGVRDQFGRSGTPQELVAHYRLGAPAIAEAVKAVIQRKR